MIPLHTKGLIKPQRRKMGSNNARRVQWPWAKHGSPELAMLRAAGRRMTHQVYDYGVAVELMGDKGEIFQVTKLKNNEKETVGFRITKTGGQQYDVYMVHIGYKFLPEARGSNYHIYFKWMIGDGRGISLHQ